MEQFNTANENLFHVQNEEISKYMLDDLQLAAELGKTLLERNKELECSLKQHQTVIDDQTQEIEYLTKQTVALREVNDSRLRIYEQLDVSIQDLERTNHRLAIDNASEKKHIKTLITSVEILETRNDDVNQQYEDMKHLLEIERRKNERILKEQTSQKAELNSVKLRHVNSYNESSTIDPDIDETCFGNTSSIPENCSFAFRSPIKNKSFQSETTEDCFQDHHEYNEDLIQIMTELELTKKHCRVEEQRVTELEEQLVAIIQENQALQSRISQVATNEEIKSFQDELSILEEVRHGQLCSRCLGNCEDKEVSQADTSSIMADEDDDRSLMDLLNNSECLYRSAVTIKENSTITSDSHDLQAHNPNPYRELVEKYEALLEVQRHSMGRNRITNLHEETSGEFSSINTKYTDEDNSSADIQQSPLNRSILKQSTGTGTRRKINLRTPTDFSEAETSSSGYSDETSNKSTQTDERQGYFLCTIADGEDCQFSIYDDASPIDSRFRNRPEYRELFKEIFTVLKKAAENKKDGDVYPLLDDAIPTAVKAPPVTPATEDLPEIFDDNQSVISSAMSEQSFAMSERITKTERKKIEKNTKHDKNIQESNAPTGQQIVQDGKILTPLVRQPLEYLSVSVNVRKKQKKNRRSNNFDRSDSPILTSPRVFYTGSGKKRRPFTSPMAAGSTQFEWNGNSMTIFNKKLQSPSVSNKSNVSSNLDTSDVELVNMVSSRASHDLHKLKKLDLSYAEVLRRADIERRKN